MHCDIRLYKCYRNNLIYLFTQSAVKVGKTLTQKTDQEYAHLVLRADIKH